MKYIVILLLSTLAISCSDNEHSSISKNAGEVTRQEGMPTTGSYDKCEFQKVVLGSFEYQVYSRNSMELFWNHNSRAAYYQVIIKDTMGGTPFKSPLISGTSYFIAPETQDVNYNRLDSILTNKDSKMYWVFVYAYDSNYQPVKGHEYQHINRKIDIPLYSHTHREAGFCNQNQSNSY